MKRCPRCGETKTLDSFPRCTSRADGVYGHCKSCHRDKQRARRLNEPERVKFLKQLDTLKHYAKRVEAKRAKYQRNKDAILAAQRDYAQRNKEKVAESKRRYYANNRDAVLAYHKRYYRQNPEKVMAWNTKRMEAIVRATPEWADLALVKRIYLLRDQYAEWFGGEWHVDHIVPLRGKTVCGLHVAWNLNVIRAEDNFAKQAKFNEAYGIEEAHFETVACDILFGTFSIKKEVRGVKPLDLFAA